ncbi:MAG: aminotransferase class III-fold pyridoxal phosphate-dependent enzyme, partial [Armatimonadetes bacterium]|nr:aminotransferase class III-fold pyridoxal phosphate-dependent enzyme [Armatimonadota bacterium]
LLIGPDIPRKDIEALLSKGPVIGFKPYHLMGRHQPSFEAPIHSYVPEWAWELAHERKLVILLHLVKSLALADTENQREIVSACRKYPQARLILAHGARGFHAPYTRSGLPSLRGLQNVWFDTSGLCEPEAIIAILDEFGPRRVMWGSDFPVSERRGKCVTIGDQFAWINPSHLDETPSAPAIQAWPVGLENLRAVLNAAEQAALNAEDLQDVFCDNARRLLGLVEERAGLTQERHRQALALIPGGTNLLSKRPEMFAPGQWPAYFREARGCEVWDLDGRHYYDFSINSAGACLLGCRDPDVTRAVKRRLSLGTLSTLNPPEEVELAEELCRLHPWAEQVRLARTGGEVAAVAVRIARATTDRSVVA